MSSSASAAIYEVPIHRVYYNIPGHIHSKSFSKVKSFIEDTLAAIMDGNNHLLLRDKFPDVFEMFELMLCTLPNALERGYMDDGDNSLIEDIRISHNPRYDEEDKMSNKFNTRVFFQGNRYLDISYSKLLRACRVKVAQPIYVNPVLLDRRQEEDAQEEPSQPAAEPQQEVRRSTRKRQAPRRYEDETF